MEDPQFRAAISEAHDEFYRERTKMAMKRLAPFIAVFSATCVTLRVIHEIKLKNEDHDQD